jgi:hypothetical protein
MLIWIRYYAQLLDRVYAPLCKHVDHQSYIVFCSSFYVFTMIWIGPFQNNAPQYLVHSRAVYDRYAQYPV